MGEINVVPYIDVTLVLLIIFMITTPMLQTGVEVDLPEAEAATVEQKDGGLPPIVISIKKEGKYYINVDGLTDDEVQPEDVNARVTAVLATNKAPQVLINANKTIEYGVVVTVMADLKKAGIPNVGLMTKSDDSQ